MLGVVTTNLIAHIPTFWTQHGVMILRHVTGFTLILHAPTYARVACAKALSSIHIDATTYAFSPYSSATTLHSTVVGSACLWDLVGHSIVLCKLTVKNIGDAG